MTNFIRTVSTFYRNEYMNPYRATFRHVGWAVRKLFNNFPCDLTVGNFVVRIADRSIANGCGALLNALGFYDPNNMLFIEEIFKDGRYNTFFDVGANIGVYSLIASSQAPGAKIFAFEPHPYTFSLLEENVRLNHMEERIFSYQQALSDHDGTVLFLDRAGSPENRVVEKSERRIKTLKVKSKRGDAFCNERKVSAQVLKIDVEGYENQVLAGFVNALQGIQLVFVECWQIGKTIKFFRDNSSFLGPYKIDYKRRRFASGNIHSEDWLFVNPKALRTLSEWRPLG